MTLVDIITRALVELGRNTDAQSTGAWKDKLTLFANEGMEDLADYLDIKRTDTVTAVDGRIDLKDLSRRCNKVISASKGTKAVTVTESVTGFVAVSDSGEMNVTYRYLPDELKNDTDVPDIPEWLHPLLVTYVVYRDHLTLDPSQQARANVFGQMYERGKLNARKKLGESDVYSIYNYGW